MKTRLLAAIAAAAAVLAMAPPADAATTVTFDRNAFDGTPTVNAAGWTLSAATSGEFGGWLDLAVVAADGTIPANGSCEPAQVDAILTVDSTETFTIHTTAELCAHVVDGTPSLFGSFDAKHVSYTGTHRKAKLVGDGFVSSGRSFLGAQGTISLAVRW